MLHDPLLQALACFAILLFCLHRIENSGLLPMPKLFAQGASLALGMVLVWRIANHLL